MRRSSSKKRPATHCDNTFARISGGIAERTLRQNRSQHERLVRIAEAVSEVVNLAAVREKRAKKVTTISPPAVPRSGAALKSAAG